MPICPKGHRSATGDYCDQCGVPLGGPGPGAGGPDQGGPDQGGPDQGGPDQGGPDQGGPEPGPAQAVPVGAPCPDCATPRDGRFCEVCGRDFLAVAAPGGDPAPPGPAVAAPGWRLVAAADAAHHARMLAAGGPASATVPLPPYVPERRFVLGNRPVLIGRSSRTRGTRPDIDLSGSPQDIGVSHAHAMLVPLPDGAWAIVDLDSANGTYINDSPDPIDAQVPVRLDDGDRVHLGAFTTLTLHRVTAHDRGAAGR